MGNFIKYKRLTTKIEKDKEFENKLEEFFNSIVQDGSEIIYYNEHNTSDVVQKSTPTGIQEVSTTFVNITVVVGRRNQIL